MTTALDGLAVGLDRFVHVPAEFASYDTSAADAARFLAVPPAQLDALAAAGLEHRPGADGDPRFDYVDLVNVATFAGGGRSVPELALRFLLRFAASPASTWYEPRDWEVTVRLPTMDGPVAVRVPDLAADGVAALPEQPGPAGVKTASPGTSTSAGAEFVDHGYRSTVRLSGTAQTIRDPHVRAVWTDVVETLRSGRVVYQMVPESLRRQPELAWSLGQADCIVVARLLAARIAALGQPTRARRGYLLGLVGSDHAWCEVAEDGVWKSLDGIFAFVASGGGRERGFALDAPAFAHACAGSRFNRLLPCVGEDAAPLVLVDGQPAPPWALAGVGARPWRSA